MTLHDEQLLIESSRMIRKAEAPAYTLARMSTAPDDREIDVILGLDCLSGKPGEQVRVFRYDTPFETVWMDANGDGAPDSPPWRHWTADELDGWLKPTTPDPMDLPLIPESDWLPEWRAFDDLSEELDNDRQAGREGA